MQNPRADEKKKLLVLAIVGLVFILGFAWILNKSSLALYRSDLYLRWYAIDKLFSEGRSLYDSRNGQEVTAEVWGEHGLPWSVNFYYPAHLMVLIGPLNLLAYPAAHLVWTAAGQVFYLLGIWLCMRRVRWPGSLHKQTVLIVAAALFIPYLQHTIWGQFGTIGVLSLVLCLFALRRHSYGLAGILATGLTFKPHTTALTLGVLLLWALLRRERWRFYLGFGLVSLAFWAIAEAFQPRWAIEFLSSLSGYGATESGLDLLWNPGQVVAGLLCLVTLTIVVGNRRAPPTSLPFSGCIALSLAVWSLVVPTVGMMHVVLLPIAVVLLLAGLKAGYPKLYRFALYGIILIYGLGIVGFTWGLSSPERYGQHILWSEYAYKVVAPIYIGLFCLPLCVHDKKRKHCAVRDADAGTMSPG